MLTLIVPWWNYFLGVLHCSAVSRQLIKKVLGQMKKVGEVKLVGKGRGARWEAMNRPLKH